MEPCLKPSGVTDTLRFVLNYTDYHKPYSDHHQLAIHLSRNFNVSFVIKSFNLSILHGLGSRQSLYCIY